MQCQPDNPQNLFGMFFSFSDLEISKFVLQMNDFDTKSKMF